MTGTHTTGTHTTGTHTTETRMGETETPALAAEFLGRDVPDPAARDVTPGWIGRNRAAILRGRAMAQALSLAAPPHVRLALTAAGIAADGLLFAEDWRRGALDGRGARNRAGRLVLEGAAILAASRLAPALVARHRARIEAARAVARRLDPCGTV